jgi:hypothetical protein
MKNLSLSAVSFHNARGVSVARNRSRTTRSLLAPVLAAGVLLVLPRGAATQAPVSPAQPAARPPSPFTPPDPIDIQEHEGWTRIFDGATLAGWSGNPDVWSVDDGAITAISTAERRVGSTHIIWMGGEPADFELKLQMKLDGDIHSGIAYRSYVDLTRGSAAAGRRQGLTGTAPPAAAGGRGAVTRNPPAIPADPRWTLYGPGLDFDYDRQMAGNVEERGTTRREIAWRGGLVRAEAGKRPRVVGVIGDADALMAQIHADDWNTVHIIARGNQMTHIINGQVMAVLVDEDPAYFRAVGRIGLQIEMYGTGRVSFREIWLKQFRP